MRIAAQVAIDKARHPKAFCPTSRCLWRTGDGSYCPRHAPAVGVLVTDARLAEIAGYGMTSAPSSRPLLRERLTPPTVELPMSTRRPW